VINTVNSFAEKNCTILAYEVQDRYYLRDDLDLLSLDGIVDGKIIPYYQDVTGFLLRYQPDYWLANDAVNYRPYLFKSILRDVMGRASTLNSTVEINGIRFTNVWVASVKSTPQFSSVLYIYKIDYGNK
jgi:hypothetical protein